MTRHTQQLGIPVHALRRVLDTREAEGAPIVDSFEVVTRFGSGLAEGRPQTVAVYGRRDATVDPVVDQPLGAHVDEIRRALLTLAEMDLVNSITRDTDDPNALTLDVTAAAHPFPDMRVASGSTMYMAPLGTPMPTKADMDLAAAGWTPMGTIDDDGIHEAPSADDVPDTTFPTGPWSLELKPADPEAFRDFVNSLIDDQVDATIDDAARAVDEMDLDRLAAELHLMLPERIELEDGLFRPNPRETEINGKADLTLEYSADAIVQWFRQELAIARRRAYHTGYAFGRHAGEHQEPTA
jgi:hypothetical protein